MCRAEEMRAPPGGGRSGNGQKVQQCQREEGGRGGIGGGRQVRCHTSLGTVRGAQRLISDDIRAQPAATTTAASTITTVAIIVDATTAILVADGSLC